VARGAFVDAGCVDSVEAVDEKVDGADSWVVRCSKAYFQKLLLLAGRAILTPLCVLWFIAAALSLVCEPPCVASRCLIAVACGCPSKCVCNALASCSLYGFFLV
jgi:hypothetical protein